MSEELKNMIVTKAAELAIIGAVLWAAKAHKKYTRALRWREAEEEDERTEEMIELQGQVSELEFKVRQLQLAAQKPEDAPPYPGEGGAVKQV